jgi:CRISPR-associated protein Cmr2
MSLNQILNKKLIAYFHDPPWKAWIITEKKTFLAKKGGHEADATELLRRLNIQDPIPKDVEIADKLSATIDRWVIRWLYGEGDSQPSQGRGSQQVSKIASKLNLFSPEYEFGIQNRVIPDKDVQDYVDKLANIVNNEPNYKYHLVYFLAPLLWYDKFKDTPPLADTRVPTHTIFDHATATAAMTNIVKCEGDEAKFSGSVVIVEIPSIQEFISYSRKSRDLWASSWLTSVLLWNSIKGFVEEYGPDIVLRPELSLNHFFIAWLYNSVSNNDVKNAVKEYAEKYAGLTDFPRIAMMSERVILLLPEENEEHITKKIRDGFNKAWKIIAEEALNESNESIFRKSSEITFQEVEKNYLEKAKENPPITPIVKVFKVNKIYNDFYDKVKEKVSCNGIPPMSYSLFFEYLLHAALGYTKVKYSYGSKIAGVIEELTKNSYKVCTVCGLLPAIFYYYDDDDKLDIRDEGADDRLCPYCAVKRMLRSMVVSNVVNKVNKLGLSIQTSSWKFPSTSELSMLNFAYHWENQTSNQRDSSSNQNKRSAIELMNKFFENPSDSENYCKCYSGDANACHKVGKEKLNLLKKYGNIYYAIIKADGDNLGKYWKGLLLTQDGKFLSLQEYLNIVFRYLRELEKNPSLDQQIENLVSKTVLTINKLRSELYNSNNSIESIPVTMAYVYTLSRSLTVQAIIDKQLLQKYGAFPIYLGGDDILALAPIRFSGEWGEDKLVVLDSVKETRQAYWSYLDLKNVNYDGFKSLKGMVVDSLRTYGRSYAVFIAHYRDPLTMSISLANYYLGLKDDVTREDDVPIGEEKIKRKDVLFVSSGRGMAQLMFSAIKMSKGSDLSLQLLDFMNLIDEKMKGYDPTARNRDISKSFIYDSLQLKEYAELACSQRDAYKEIYYYLIKRIVSRNAKENVAMDVIKEIEENPRIAVELRECIEVKGKKKEPYINVISSLSEFI